jgi:hypothetical protein
VTAGGRHAAITAVAAHLIAKGIGEEYAGHLVQAYNQTYCDPPKSPREVADVLRWVVEREREKHAALAAGLVTASEPTAQARRSTRGSGISFRSHFAGRSA